MYTDEAIIHDFVLESLDMIDQIEPKLIEISSSGGGEEADHDTIHTVFRLFHSMKGSAGFMNLKTIQRVTHETETFLDHVRNGRIVLANDHISYLFRICDFLRALLDRVNSTLSDGGSETEAEGYIAELTQLTQSSLAAGAAAPQPAQTAAAQPAPPPQPTPPQEAQPATAAPQTAQAMAQAMATEDLFDQVRAGYLAAQGEAVTPPPAAPPAPPQSDEEALRMVLSPEMVEHFQKEANELLDQSEQNLLDMEKNPDNAEDLFDTFRRIHSFKGNCGMMGFADLERLSHKMETFLELMKDGRVAAGKHAITMVLNLLDILRGGLNDISSGGEGKIIGLNALLELIDEEIPVSEREAAAPPKPAPRPLIETAGAKPAPPAPAMAAPIESQPGDDHHEAAMDALFDQVRSQYLNQGKEPAAAPAAKPAPQPAPRPAAQPAAQPAAKPAPPAAPLVTAAQAAATAAALAQAAPPSPPPAAMGGAMGGAMETGPRDLSKRTSASEKQAVMRKDIRVDLDKLDVLVDLVGELIIAESMVSQNPDLLGHEFERFEKAASHLNKITREIQDIAMSLRMVPLSTVFRKMIRLVHDLSQKSGKELDLVLRGEETEVDKTVIELISDPLVHMIRNSVDHGIETPAERLAEGKPSKGTVVIEARHEGGEVWVIVKDDGRGLDREKILAKAVQRGLVKGDGSDMRDEDVFRIIFEPGFSTAEKVTDVSGRGVGMDVVRRNLERIKGRIDIHSIKGKGSRFIMRIPLTLAIIEGMLIQVGDRRYIIPMTAIRESIQVKKEDITVTMDGQELVKLRGRLYPVVRLHQVHNIIPLYEKLEDGLLMLMEHQGVEFCLFVDELVGQLQTVIKGLSGMLSSVRGISGCAILGDGDVSLILDVGSLVEMTTVKPFENQAQSSIDLR